MLVIHPDECIDCGCVNRNVPPTPSSRTPSRVWKKWLEVNTEYAKTWPNITRRRNPRDAKDFEGMEGKFENIFLRRWNGRLIGGGIENLR